MWHVSTRSGVATSRTAIHLLLTYLLTYSIRELHPRTAVFNGPFAHTPRCALLSCASKNTRSVLPAQRNSAQLGGRVNGP